MLTIGLTGGIGSGKSVVAEFFAELGITIIDADKIARELVEPGKPAWEAIIKYFGQAVIHVDGTLDRNKLRSVVFQDDETRQWLEQLLHPLIRQVMQQQLRQATSAYVIAVIPLLIENFPHPLVQRILVVDAPEALQIERVIKRDKVSPAQIRQTMQAQVSRAQRLAKADDVIINEGDLITLKEHVLALHQRYLGMAAGAAA